MLDEIILEINNLILLYKEIYLYYNLEVYNKNNTEKFKFLLKKYQNSIYKIIKKFNNLNISILLDKDKKLLEHNYNNFKEYTITFSLKDRNFFSEINKLNDKLEKYWSNYFIKKNNKNFTNKLKKIIFCTGGGRLCPSFHILFFTFFVFLIILGYFFPDTIKKFKIFYMSLTVLDFIFLITSIFIALSEEEFKKNFICLYFKYMKKIIKS